MHRPILRGAFGPPNAQPGAFTTPNSAYLLNSSTNIRIGQEKFDSFYGNLRFHLGENTELAAALPASATGCLYRGHHDLRRADKRRSVNVVISAFLRSFRALLPDLRSSALR